MEYLKQSAAKTVRIGPFLDDGDGKTIEDSLTLIARETPLDGMNALD